MTFSWTWSQNNNVALEMGQHRFSSSTFLCCSLPRIYFHCFWQICDRLHRTPLLPSFFVSPSLTPQITCSLFLLSPLFHSRLLCVQDFIVAPGGIVASALSSSIVTAFGWTTFLSQRGKRRGTETWSCTSAARKLETLTKLKYNLSLFIHSNRVCVYACLQ